VVTRIPRGATNLDIRQYAPDDDKDDDIYLGKFYRFFPAMSSPNYFLFRQHPQTSSSSGEVDFVKLFNAESRLFAR